MFFKSTWMIMVFNLACIYMCGLYPMRHEKYINYPCPSFEFLGMAIFMVIN